MTNRHVYESIARHRQIVQLAVQRFAALTAGGDDDNARAADVRERLDMCDDALVRAAGGVPTWLRTLIGALSVGSVVWLVASGTHLIGLQPGWVITAAVAAAMAMGWPWYLAITALPRRLGRRRTRPFASMEIQAPDGIDPAVEIRGVLQVLRGTIARTLDRYLAEHRQGRIARSAAGFEWLAGREPILFWLCRADGHACVAIEAVDIWDSRRDLR
ncbi:MAG TPA: hypothetical protein VF062_05365 [Candidatus Limnocylindrales bacterium]